MIVEYASIVSAMAVLASTLAGAFGDRLAVLPTTSGGALSALSAGAKAQKVSPGEARAAYQRAPYSKPVLKYLYAVGWIGGKKSPLSCLTQARYGISWGAIGAAMACYDEALRYARNRVMFDRPIAQTQIQQVRLVDMLTEITKAQFMTLQLGRLKDAGTMSPDQVSLCKRNNVDMACDAAREARRLLGANGILAEYHSMRHMANLESVYTYEGTHDMHSLIVGQSITGFGAFQ